MFWTSASQKTGLRFKFPWHLVWSAMVSLLNACTMTQRQNERETYTGNGSKTTSPPISWRLSRLDLVDILSLAWFREWNALTTSRFTWKTRAAPITKSNRGIGEDFRSCYKGERRKDSSSSVSSWFWKFRWKLDSGIWEPVPIEHRRIFAQYERRIESWEYY